MKRRQRVIGQEMGGNSKLARLVQTPWHDAGSSGDPIKQGVFAMSIAKFQNAAVAFAGALIVAALFVGAAIEPVITLA